MLSPARPAGGLSDRPEPGGHWLACTAPAALASATAFASLAAYAVCRRGWAAGWLRVHGAGVPLAAALTGSEAPPEAEGASLLGGGGCGPGAAKRAWARSYGSDASRATA